MDLSTFRYHPCWRCRLLVCLRSVESGAEASRRGGEVGPWDQSECYPPTVGAIRAPDNHRRIELYGNPWPRDEFKRYDHRTVLWRSRGDGTCAEYRRGEQMSVPSAGTSPERKPELYFGACVSVFWDLNLTSGQASRSLVGPLIQVWPICWVGKKYASYTTYITQCIIRSIVLHVRIGQPCLNLTPGPRRQRRGART